MNKKIYRFFYKKKKIENFIVAAAIGNKCYNEFIKYSLPLWLRYCKQNNIGLLIFHDYIIKKNDINWKSATWQKHLFGEYILKNFNYIKNICLLDTDILINPFSPNIFNYLEKNKISVISHLKNLPYKNDENSIRKKIAFYRHNFFSKKYPLDSSITASNKQIFSFHNLKDPKNYFCMGVIVFNLKRYSNIIKDIYFRYSIKRKNITGGNEVFSNYEIQKRCKLKWIDYKFQTYWNFEIVEKYPFLFKYKKKKNQIIRMCVEASLRECYFLHFSGTWYECDHWKIKGIFQNKSLLKLEKKLILFKKKKLKNKIHSNRIVPSNISVIKKI